MLNRKIALVTVLLSVFSVAPVWALGEPAGEVIDLIEIEQVVPVKNDSAERYRRITASRNAAVRKQAEEKATEEKRDSDRLAAQKEENELKRKQTVGIEASEKRENDRLAAQQAINDLKKAVEKAADNKQQMARLAEQIAADEQKMAAERAAAETIEKERLAALARVEELRRAEETAAAEKKEQDRLAALRAADEMAAAEKREAERLAARKAEEARVTADAAAARYARRTAALQVQEHSAVETALLPGADGQPVTAKMTTVASPSLQTELSVAAASQSGQQNKHGKQEGAQSGKSWWSAFTGKLGLTDTDPGVIAQPVLNSAEFQSSDYVIGPGDIIGVSVWKDENLTRTVVVLPDGKISLPLVGELVAEGKTVAQFKREVEKALSRYTADSTVTVEVKQLNSMFIYVIGRVNLPGRQSLVANTNVLQALAMVGGPNPFAKTGEIKIFRQHEGKTTTYSFNYDEIMKGRHLETNIELKRGDVIIVP